MEQDFDKKLVKEGKLTFKLNDTNYCTFTLTDDGMVEYSKNNILESVKPFSKLTLTRDCKLKIQEGYQIDTTDIDLPAAESNLKDQINAVDKLQNLKDELETKVDKLVNEGVEDTQKYCVLQYEARTPNDEFEVLGVVDPNWTSNDLTWIDSDKILDGLDFGISKEEANRLKDVVDKVNNTWSTTVLKSVVCTTAEAIEELKKDKEKTLNTWYGTIFTDKILTKQEILNLDDNTRFTYLQQEFINNKGDTPQDIIKGLKHLANSFDIDDEPIISITNYIKELYNLDESSIYKM